MRGRWSSRIDLLVYGGRLEENEKNINPIESLLYSREHPSELKVEVDVEVETVEDALLLYPLGTLHSPHEGGVISASASCSLGFLSSSCTLGMSDGTWNLPVSIWEGR